MCGPYPRGRTGRGRFAPSCLSGLSSQRVDHGHNDREGSHEGRDAAKRPRPDRGRNAPGHQQFNATEQHAHPDRTGQSEHRDEEQSGHGEQSKDQAHRRTLVVHLVVGHLPNLFRANADRVTIA